ncbi:MAG: L,D-transpeptidase family protein [Thiotrichales bacterium]|nr:L,D-transpeptidase family protein [Thiotrichales bacterium]
MKSAKRFLPVLLALPLSWPVALYAAVDNPPSFSEEQGLLAAYAALQKLDLPQALHLTQALIERYPNYKAAQILKADLYAIRANQTSLMLRQQQKYQKQLLGFQEEGRLRWTFEQNTLETEGLNYVMKTAESGYLIMVDAKLHRLYLYEQTSGGLVKKEDFYIMLGQAGIGKEREGDKKTPIGIYHINGWIDGKTLPDLYGEGALTLNYPNAWDRELGRTGSGIWLHGTPQNTLTREPLSSRGCVVLTNSSVKRLRQSYDLGEQTPVIILSGEGHAEPLDSTAVLSQVYQHFQNVTLQEPINYQTLSVLQYPDQENMVYLRYQSQQGQWHEEYWQRHESQWQVMVKDPNARQLLADIRQPLKP